MNGLAKIIIIFITLQANTVIAIPITSLELHSEEGELIGLGQSYYYSTPNDFANATARDWSGDGLVDHVWFGFSERSFGDSWSLVFGSDRLGLELLSGEYNDVMRASSGDLGHAGLDISGNHRGANRITGNFTIIDAVYDYSAPSVYTRLVSFAATFEQHVEGYEPALYGTIYYNYEVLPEPNILLIFMTGLLLFIAQRKLIPNRRIQNKYNK